MGVVDTFKLGHLTCSKLIFYGKIGNFHINRIFFIISGEHIKKLVFDFFFTQSSTVHGWYLALNAICIALSPVLYRTGDLSL